MHLYVVMAEREETAVNEFKRLAEMIDVEAADNFIRFFNRYGTLCGWGAARRTIERA